MTSLSLILITITLVLLALAINWLYYFLITRKVISHGSYFDYQEYYDATKTYMVHKGGASLSFIQERQDCTKSEALFFIRKYIKDGVLRSKKNGEKYDIADNKAMYDFRYDFVKRAVSSSRSTSRSFIKHYLSCDDTMADKILIDLENEGIIGPVNFLENRLQEEDREVLRDNFSLEDGEDYLNAKDFVIATSKASTSSLQTAFRWGYNKSARIINDLERGGVIGPVRQGERYREILNGEKSKHETINEDDLFRE